MITNFHNELVAAGLDISGCGGDGSVNWKGAPNELLAVLVWAAHEQLLTSTECLALQAAITNEQWLAYQDVRKAPIRQQREQRYKTECDSLYLTITENAIKTNTTPDYSSWITAKENIRTELPYEE